MNQTQTPAPSETSSLIESAIPESPKNAATPVENQGMSQKEMLLKLVRSIPKEEMALWVADNNLMGLFQKVQEDALKISAEQERQRVLREKESKKLELKRVMGDVKWAKGNEYKKVVRCITAAFNAKAKASFIEMFKTGEADIHWRFMRDEETPSDFLKEALDYFFSKQRIEPDWVEMVLDQGVVINGINWPCFNEWRSQRGIRDHYDQWLNALEGVNNFKDLEQEIRTINPNYQGPNVMVMLEGMVRCGLERIGQSRSYSGNSQVEKNQEETLRALKLMRRAYLEGCSYTEFNESMSWSVLNGFASNRNAAISEWLGEFKNEIDIQKKTWSLSTRLFELGAANWKSDGECKKTHDEAQSLIQEWFDEEVEREDFQERILMSKTVQYSGVYLNVEAGNANAFHYGGRHERGSALRSYAMLNVILKDSNRFELLKKPEIVARLKKYCELEAPLLAKKPELRYSEWGYSRFGWIAKIFGNEASATLNTHEATILPLLEYFLSLGDHAGDFVPKNPQRQFNNSKFREMLVTLEEKQDLEKAMNSLLESESGIQKENVKARRL